MRKRFTPYLRLGDQVRAEVREVLPNGDLIVSFEGDLLNVKNQSSRTFNAGEEAWFRVTRTQPLGFQLISGMRKARGELNRRV